MNNDLYLFSMYSIHNRKVRNKRVINTITTETTETTETPDSSKSIEEYFEKLIKYKYNIIEFTKGTLESPIRGPTADTSLENPVERRMNEAFLKFTLACIEHFEKKEESSIEESDDDNLMFDPFTKMKKVDSVDVSFTSLKTMKTMTKEKYPDK